MNSCKVTTLLIASLQGCALGRGDDADVSLEGPASAPSAEGDTSFAINEILRDSCRQWCGVKQVLEGDCVQGQAVLRGVLLGTEPFPDEPPKSYDLACIDDCLAGRRDGRCWQQVAEANECYARNAVFVCVKSADWDVYGCETAGTDPAVCGVSD
jgi:hypothetical protein